MWFYVGMSGAFCFILIQLVLLIDFAHSWNESWVEKMEEGNSRCWYAGIVLQQELLHFIVYYVGYIIHLSNVFQPESTRATLCVMYHFVVV